MRPKTTFVIAVTALSLALASGIVPGQVMRQPEGLTIFFTGDSDAQISSCGCPTEDYGGTSRRAAFLDTLRTGGWHFLTVDAGGIAPFKAMNAQSRLKTEVMAGAIAAMRYDAVTLGDVDLAPGPAFVADLVKTLGAPIVATNYDLPSGSSERTRIVESRGRKVGILAFLDPSLAKTEASWLAVEPWEDQRGRVDALAGQVDFLVALVHAPDSAAVNRLLRLYPRIDLLVAAHLGQQPAELRFLGSQAVVGVSSQGRHLGRVEVSFPEGAPRKIEAAYLPVRKEWGHRAAVDDLIAAYSRRVKELAADSTFQSERLGSLREPVTHYTGNGICVSCHKPQGTQWATTLHSHARETLEKASKAHDTECQACHTTGFGYLTGFATPETTPIMWNVGCEACHGPGGNHLIDLKKPYGAVSEETCLGCHTPNNSPAFDYATYRPKIVHGGGGGGAADPGRD